MDDESKGTPQTEKIVAELQKEGYEVKIHVRRKGEGRGLSSAVLLGFEKAKYATVMCMDADLQHEPESVPAVADPVSSRRNGRISVATTIDRHLPRPPAPRFSTAMVIFLWGRVMWMAARWRAGR